MAAVINLMGIVNMPDVRNDENIVASLVKQATREAGEWIAGDWMAQASHTYAPVSPTQDEIDRERARRKGVRVSKVRKTRLRRKTKNKPTPGGLERSIHAVCEGEGEDMKVSCYVRTPSEAQDYANVIHNAKGTRWFNRGIGTREKGEKADEKFIERARDENLKRYFAAIDKAIQRRILGK